LLPDEIRRAAAEAPAGPGERVTPGGVIVPE
jgi:hypothetical protein